MTEPKYPSLAGIFLRAVGLFVLLNGLAHTKPIIEGFSDGWHGRPRESVGCCR